MGQRWGVRDEGAVRAPSLEDNQTSISQGKRPGTQNGEEIKRPTKLSETIFDHLYTVSDSTFTHRRVVSSIPLVGRCQSTQLLSTHKRAVGNGVLSSIAKKRKETRTYQSIF